MKLDVITLANTSAGSVDLNEAIFGLPARADLLHRAVQWQLAKRRAGTHKTKTISEIRGTTKKPHRQKGTGHARQGSLRSAQMRGGATIFGPVVRDHGYALPKKVRKLALKTALSAKQAEGKLKVIDAAVMKEPKTAQLLSQLTAMELKNVLFIDGKELEVNFCRALGNIPYADVLPAQGANVYDILAHDYLVITKEGVKALEERLA